MAFSWNKQPKFIFPNTIGGKIRNNDPYIVTRSWQFDLTTKYLTASKVVIWKVGISYDLWLFFPFYRKENLENFLFFCYTFYDKNSRTCQNTLGSWNRCMLKIAFYNNTSYTLANSAARSVPVFLPLFLLCSINNNIILTA